MVQTILEICLSEMLASGNREYVRKDLSRQAMLIPDARTAVNKEWKEVIQRHTKTTIKESPLCCIDGHPLIQKYMYTTEKCSKEQHYFFTWEIILCLMNLYIVQKSVVNESCTDENFVTEFNCSPQRSDPFDHCGFCGERFCPLWPF